MHIKRKLGLVAPPSSVTAAVSLLRLSIGARLRRQEAHGPWSRSLAVTDDNLRSCSNLVVV